MAVGRPIASIRAKRRRKTCARRADSRTSDPIISDFITRPAAKEAFIVASILAVVRSDCAIRGLARVAAAASQIVTDLRLMQAKSDGIASVLRLAFEGAALRADASNVTFPRRERGAYEFRGPIGPKKV